MSVSSDRLEGFDFDRVLEWVEAYYHVVLVAALMVFMFWNRVRTWGRFVRDGEVLFAGNDPWYHYRQTTYVVHNWPQTMPYDVWTNFPYGTSSSQFGTLLDQIVATVALIVGLGNPDDGTIAMTVLVAPVVIATLAAIPTYFIGRRLGGRFGGVVAVAVIALTSGRFLRLSSVGFADHHIWEAFFQSVAVLAVLVAVAVATREKPIYEQVQARDFEPLRRPLGWAALAGVAVGLYLWVWSFGVLLLGILGVFFVVQLSLEFVRGESPEHTAFAGAVAMAVTTVVVLSSINVVAITASDFSLLQPMLALLVGVGCVFMAWLAREWESRDLARAGYPVAVVGLVVAGALVMSVVLPDLFGYFVDQIFRVVGFSTSPTAGTVGEAQPLPAARLLYDNYGFAVLIAAGAGVWILGRILLGRPVSAEETFVLVWAAFMTAATFTQGRFEYYLTIPIAALTGYAVGGVFRWLNLSFDPTDVEVYQVIAVAVVVMILVVPMSVGASSVVAVGDRNGVGGSTLAWNEALEWTEENTPAEGTYGGASNELEYYGTYDRTEDFDYPEGAYGVMSWWDYGHWITVQGERIPNANPFQQGSDTAANFLLAPNETAANDVLQDVDEDDAQTRYVMVDWQMVEPTGSVLFFSQRQQTRGKFFAPPNFYSRGDVSIDDYTGRLYGSRGNQVFTYNYTNQAYSEAMVNRLYHYHGSAAEPQPMVLDWSPQTLGNSGRQLPVSPPEDGRAIKFFPTMEQARAYVANDSTSMIGGLGPHPSERVPALEHYRLVGSSERSATGSPNYNIAQLAEAYSTNLNVSNVPSASECTSDLTLGLQDGSALCLEEAAYDLIHPTSPQWTKVFERVPGAQIQGSIPGNASVRATVEMYNPASGETFEYTQQVESGGDGEFSMTVPYSTTGYDEWGPENGHTNVSVRATGEYSIIAVSVDDGTPQFWNGTASVPESAVVGETDEPITVELSEVQDVPEGQEIFEGNGSGGDESSGDGTTDGNQTNGALAEPTTTDAIVAP